MQRLKILLLTSIPYGPYRADAKLGDGPDRHAAARALARLGIEMRTISPYGFPWNPLAGRHPLFQSLDPIRSLQALVAGRHYDLVIAGNDGPAVLLVLLRRLFRLKTPILIWDFSPAESWRLRAWLQDITVPKVAGVLALPSLQESYIREKWGRHLQVVAIGQLVDTDFYCPQPARLEGYVLSVGDDGGRDYQTLLTAAAGLDIDLTIKTSQPLAPSNDSRARIRQVSERLSYADLRTLYAGSAFVVVPLTAHPHNASGVNAVQEASAMGKALIVSDSDGVRDFVRPGETCLAVPAGDPPALAAAIRRLQDEPDTRRRLGDNARRFAEEQFAPDAFARRFAAAARRFIPGGDDQST